MLQLSQDTSLDFPKEDSPKNTLETKKNFETLNNFLVSPETLDYSKIKLHLKSNDTRAKLLLLQALRQVINSKYTQITCKNVSMISII